MVVVSLLQNKSRDFLKDVGLEPIVKKGRRTKTGSSKKCQMGVFEPELEL